MNIGLDIHGCVDLYPDSFRELSKKWIKENHSIHIITGQEWEKAKKTIQQLRIPYTHHFSIVDYHLSIGTKMHQDKKKTWWMDNKIWVASKGEYCRRNKIDIHFDDSVEYGKYMPDTCTFILVPKKRFDNFLELCFNDFS